MEITPLILLYLIKPFLKIELWDKTIFDVFVIYRQYIATFAYFQNPEANHYSGQKKYPTN
jgi:hypothetical protein